MKLKSIIYNLRKQPVITAVSIIGTALAIFLLMVVVMIQQTGVMEMAPEINRNRTLHVRWICINSEEYQISGSMSRYAAEELLGNLEDVESLGIYTDNENVEASIPGKPLLVNESRKVNGEFFNIIKYDFIQGAPFTEDEVNSGQKVAVINETVARSLFGRTDVVNCEINIDRFPYRIKGVIKDVNPVTTIAYTDILLPVKSKEEEMAEKGGGTSQTDLYQGDNHVILLAKEKEAIPKIKSATAARYAMVNNKLRSEGLEIMYFDVPLTQEEFLAESGSNVATDIKEIKKRRIALFVILLLVPAINLSSITQNRLRQRFSEIGIKRAFGCTRGRIMGEVFVENLVYTAAGAIIGLALSLVTAWMFADFLFMNNNMFETVAAKATFSPLSMLSWETFGWAILFCLILNLLSCGVPVWIASRINPAMAIKGHLSN